MWWLPRMAANNFNTISATVKSYPKNQKGRYIIYVKAGVYDKYITVKKNMVNIFMYGDGRRKTMVTGNKSNREGFSTFRTATFSAIGAGFICKSIGFRNTACPEAHQAMALHVGLLQLQNGRLPGHVVRANRTS
nr:probable pectinesterase/pectinesterase inhibitor 13 [Ziziphus jujuba var. spinosa]